MEDRLKFRAYDKKHKWVTDVTCLNMGTWRDIILVDQRSPIAASYCQSTDNVIIEQCTGLKDKNGRLIFEGDIMQYPESKEVFIVKIDRLTGKYLAWFGEDEFGEDDQLALFLQINDRGKAVVIGNIHENQELLEG